MRAVSLYLVALFLAVSAHGQDVAFEAELADSVVVTATRQNADIRETGRRVTVLTARDLDHLPAASIDEIIRYVGGIETQSRGGFGIQSDVSMRGSSFDGVVILLDGVRIHDPQTGHFLTNFPVPKSEIARVEVVRGPAASLYGPDAVGGVIQFFTWSGLAASQIGPRSSFSATYGRHSLYDAEAALRGRVAGAVVSAATNWQGSDGQPVLDVDGRPIVGSGGDVRTDFRRNAHSVAVSGTSGSLALMGRAGLDVRDFGSWHFYTPFASDTARSDSRTAWTHLRLRSDDASRSTQFALNASARWQQSTYQYNPVSLANSHTNHATSVNADVTHRLTPATTIGGGVSAGLRGIDSNSMGVHDDVSIGAYGLARLSPGGGVTVNLSTRVDRDPGFGTEVTPQAGMAWSAGRITLRTGAGRAVRAATYTERYYDTERQNPSGNLGNPALRAERAWSYEGGADLYLEGASLHVTAFQRDARDVIDYVRADAGEPVFLAQNIASVQTRGLEFDAEAALEVGRARIRYAGSYALLDSKLDVPAGLQYKYTLIHARHIVQQNLTATLGRAGLGLRGLWKEPLSGDAFFVADARFSYRLAPPISVTAEVRNIFDAAYSEVFDAPMPRRWWLVGLRYR